MSNNGKIVLTGGPCAGKTTVSRLLTHAFEKNVMDVPEAASLLFNGGFPRSPIPDAIRASQRAIFSVQHQLEASFVAQYPDRVLILDRGSVDGAAYWPDGTENFFLSMGTTLEAELGRYEKVIYLESAGKEDYFLHKQKNPNRREDWEEAKALDEKTFALWSKHPNFFHIENQRSFYKKVSQVLRVVATGLPLEESSLDNF